MRLLPATLVAALLATAAPAAAAPYFDAGQLPAPPVTGKELADSVAAFSEGHPNRVTGSPSEAAATDELVAEAEALGYVVEVVPFSPLGTGPLHAVVATKKGRTKPDEHIVFGAHYDTVPQTIEGAYDNGTGTMMLRG